MCIRDSQYRYKHRYSFRIVDNPLHEQVGPNGDNHLDGYGQNFYASLRWHYPNQVNGSKVIPSSQPVIQAPLLFNCI